MEFLTQKMTEAVRAAFRSAGYPADEVRVIPSNRPDLCAFQCNGAMALAKTYRRAPLEIATAVAAALRDEPLFRKAEAVAPGFLNLDLDDAILTDTLSSMMEDDRLGCATTAKPQTVIVDYGGANVAKPLHVGHLRSAVIGEAVKRMLRFAGHNVIGDVHLGDWGLQMGLIICQLADEQPDLPYFDETFDGPYPTDPPFDITALESIYPRANARAKEDEDFKERAREATVALQQGNRAYRAIWEHILNVSIRDLKRNYDRLSVTFDLWKKESDAQPYIPDMIAYLKEGGYTRLSEGALVVDVKRPDDKKEIPPCMILKSDGATLYNTTDLATLVEREKLFHPDRIIYVVDKRQGLYFEQVFRCAVKTGIAPQDTTLTFLGFGTMNGRDGKPFKTRDGGVMRLQSLLDDITRQMAEKINRHDAIDAGETLRTAEQIALAAIKYGDLSNQAAKDYIFDVDRFTSFEGETGPYILYTIVRIKSILKKAPASTDAFQPPEDAVQRDLMLQLALLNQALDEAIAECAPHKVCKYVYDLANRFNTFYHQTRILKETDAVKRDGYLSLCRLTGRALNLCIDLLGFEAPERM
ncbi:MAG: arginine--tRNA ligase [Eubacteriales bacterium]|nr:arginine--tRNA ligase [Eubacteriales bacterium]